MANGTLFTPQLIAGTASVTQFSNSVTLSGALNTALTGLTNPVITLRQFRVVSDGMIYTIASAPALSVITLDNIFLGTTNASASVQIYRCYYGYPLGSAGTEVTDFYRYKSITDLINNRSFQSLRKTRQQIDNADPQRSNQTNPFYLAAFDSDSNGRTRFEMWPHPTSLCPYRASYQKRGVDFTVVVNETIPDPIPDSLLIDGGLRYACEWASNNKKRVPELEGINWDTRSVMYERRFQDLLKVAIRQDEETTAENWVETEDSVPAYPIDSNWMQSHDTGY